MNKRELALKLGYTEAYFSYMKNKNPEKYELIFPNEKEEDLDNYVEKTMSLISKMENVMYMFEDYQEEYGLFLYKHNLTTNRTNPHMSYTNESNTIFKARDKKDYISIHLDKINKWKKIVNILGFSDE